MVRAFVSGVIAASFAVLLARPAAAAGRTISAEPVHGEKIRIDGELREWPNKMVDLGVTLQGSASGGDPRAAVTIGYDDTNLYVVLKVFDKRIVRSKAVGAKEDHATLHLAFPSGRGFASYDVKLYPGDPGKIAGSVRLKGAAPPGAKIVEAPSDKGYHLEAQIPWSAFPEAQRTRVGLRATVSYTDSDAPGSVKAVVATAAARSGRAMPPLLLEAEQGLDGALIRAKGLSSNPAREVYGNVAGDGMLERVAIFGTNLVIVGPGFRGGKEFYFSGLAIEDASMVRKLELNDFDGDGRAEIVLQRRIGGKDRYREILTVHKVGADDTPFQAFAHEIGIKTPEGSIANKVKVSGDSIAISQGESEGFEPDTYKEDLPSDMGATLLPWESVGTRTFKWRGKGFEKAGETSHTPKLASSKGEKKAKRSKGTAPVAPPLPRPPTADEMLDRVYALYRKERKASGKPSFDFVTDVAADRAPERVLIHGKDIVVFGKNFREGRSFAFISVGVAEPKDILHVTARDLTGDGKAEVIVVAVLHAKASKELGGDTVDRHALLVYGIQNDKLMRIFGAETARSLGKDRIVGAVAFTPGRRGLDIELRPARAVGWTEKSYPFPPDTTTAGGLEPLLLPWGGAAPRKYRFNGSSYVLE